MAANVPRHRVPHASWLFCHPGSARLDDAKAVEELKIKAGHRVALHGSPVVKSQQRPLRDALREAFDDLAAKAQAAFAIPWSQWWDDVEYLYGVASKTEAFLRRDMPGDHTLYIFHGSKTGVAMILYEPEWRALRK